MSNPRPIKHEEIGNFGIDESNNLYWNDKKIKAESVLGGGTKLWLWIATGLGIIGTLSGIAGGAVNVNKEFCFVESKSCPPEEKSATTDTTKEATTPAVNSGNVQSSETFKTDNPISTTQDVGNTTVPPDQMTPGQSEQIPTP